MRVPMLSPEDLKDLNAESMKGLGGMLAAAACSSLDEHPGLKDPNFVHGVISTLVGIAACFQCELRLPDMKENFLNYPKGLGYSLNSKITQDIIDGVEEMLAPYLKGDSNGEATHCNGESQG